MSNEQNIKKMENVKNYTLEINRLDYLNKIGKDYNSLPQLTNVNEIVDVNEVNTIVLYFELKEDALSFHSLFPKSYNARTGRTMGFQNEKGEYYSKYHVSFEFNTFFMSDVTGSSNETAFKRRNKVIEKLKQIL